MALSADRCSYAQLLRQCHDLDDCRRLEACLLANEHHRRDLFLRNLLIQAYGKCGSVGNAKRAFDAIAIPNVFSGNILIAAFAQAGHLHSARDLFDRMEVKNIVTWNEMITAYSHLGLLEEAKMLFQRMPFHDVVTWTALITAYAVAGDCEEARSVFDSMPDKSIVSSNAMLTAYIENGCMLQALELFDTMPDANLISWTAICVGLANMGDLERARVFFDQMPQRSLIVWNSLIHGYCRGEDLIDARELFDAMPERECSSGDVLIQRYADQGDVARAREVFLQIKGEDRVSSCTAMIGAYCENGLLDDAKILYSQAIEKDLVMCNAMLCGYANSGQLDQTLSFLATMPVYNTETWNILITANARNGNLGLARDYFEKMPLEKNVVTWNAMLASLSQNGRCEEVFKLFLFMDLEGMPANEVTLLIVIDCCTTIRDARILDACVKEGDFRFSVLIGNALVSLYSRCKALEDARSVFDSMPEHSISSYNSMITAYSIAGYIDQAKQLFQGMPQRNILSWNSMVTALSQNGHSDKAIEFYELNPNKYDQVTLAALIDACTVLSDPYEGKNIHREAIASGIQSDLVVGNSLINMYGKCGCVHEAASVMALMTCRDVLTWNAMLTAYAQNGMIQHGLRLLRTMRIDGIEPDTATHSILLSAFSHAGMVEDSCAYVAAFAGCLDSDHYMCVVDLLGRAGILNVAEMLIQQTSRQADPMLPWTTLLAACRMHGDEKIGLSALENANTLEPRHSSPYILASAIHTN